MDYSSFTKKNYVFRFADVGTLSTRMLAPIEGYERVPLVTLEEAVKPLIDIVPKVERNVFIVKQNCQEPEDGLTTDESASIMLYTEEDILLLPARQFQVTSCLDSGNGLHIVQLTELKPPFDLLEPVPLSSPSVKLISNIPVNARWTQNGVTVAGGFGYGNAIHQLDCPSGLFIDDDQRIIIADCGNHRIIQWRIGNANGQVIAGGCGSGNRLDQLHGPTDVLIDKETNSLIICDRENRRVVRWSRRGGITQEDILLDKIDGYGIAMDDRRYLYISDTRDDEVRRYKIGEKHGTVVAGGHGKGDGLNQLNWPTYIFVDRQQAVYVSDQNNHRVMKWNKGAREGIVVAGGQGKGNALKQLWHPEGLFVDTLDTVYVGDSLNHRVICWPRGAKHGTVIVGGNGCGERANQFNCVGSLSFDRYGHLYVVDYHNNRVQRFSIE
ncbi:unnamed protein product [Rotaria sp. Silwood1]|nr:unnamed protein product [Rotaria sp. Silwood1]